MFQKSFSKVLALIISAISIFSSICFNNNVFACPVDKVQDNVYSISRDFFS